MREMPGGNSRPRRRATSPRARTVLTIAHCWFELCRGGWLPHLTAWNIVLMDRNPSMYQESFISLTRCVSLLPHLDFSLTLPSRRVTHLHRSIHFSICLLVSLIVVSLFIHSGFATALFAHDSFSWIFCCHSAGRGPAGQSGRLIPADFPADKLCKALTGWMNMSNFIFRNFQS